MLRREINYFCISTQRGGMDVFNRRNLAFEVVIARYNEKVDWIVKEFPWILEEPSNKAITVYNKGIDNLSLPVNIKIVDLPNIGRETHSYFYHIINNFDNLADRVLFLQGNPYDHCVLKFEQYETLTKSNCNNINCKLLYKTPLIREY